MKTVRYAKWFGMLTVMLICLALPASAQQSGSPCDGAFDCSFAPDCAACHGAQWPARWCGDGPSGQCMSCNLLCVTLDQMGPREREQKHQEYLDHVRQSNRSPDHLNDLGRLMQRTLQGTLPVFFRNSTSTKYTPRDLVKIHQSLGLTPEASAKIGAKTSCKITLSAVASYLDRMHK